MSNSSDLFNPSPVINKEYILQNLNQEDIMKEYLDVEVQYDYMFTSPLRIDNNPTCKFSWHGGKLWFRDWAMYKPLDVFGVVQERYLCNFNEAIQIIAEDFGLKDKEESKRIAIEGSNQQRRSGRGSRDSQKSKIQVKLQKFTEDNITYLQSYGITSDTVKKFNVFSPEIVWLNEEIFYAYDKDNPALAYYFGKDEEGNEKWKIYFYKRRGDFRFLGNTSRINGWIQIPDVGELLIITKSLKDVMALYEWGIDAIAMQGESTIPYDYIIDELKERFDNIVTLYDYDDAGKRFADTIYYRYGIPYLFINEQYLGVDPGEAKDFSDYVKMHEEEDIKALVNNIHINAIQTSGEDWRSSGEELADLQQELS